MSDLQTEPVARQPAQTTRLSIRAIPRHDSYCLLGWPTNPAMTRQRGPASSKTWRLTATVIESYFPSASFLGEWRTVFNIGGNKYRLVVDMRYDLGRVYIRHVLTHAEYTRRTQEGTL